MYIFREAFRWICNPTASKSTIRETPRRHRLALPHPARRGRRISRGKEVVGNVVLLRRRRHEGCLAYASYYGRRTQRDHPFAPSICRLPETISAGLRRAKPC